MTFDSKNDSYGTIHKTAEERAKINDDNLNKESKIVRKYFQVNKNKID